MSIEKALARGEQYFEEQNYDAARIEYMNVLRRSSTESAAIAGLGRTWYASGAAVIAYPILVEAKRLLPNDIEARTDLASAALSFGDTAAAGKEAREILQLAPESGAAILVLADSVRSEAEAAEVEDLLAALPDGAKAMPEFLLARAALMAKRSDVIGASKLIDQALVKAPESADVLTAHANILAAMGDAEKAIEALKPVAENSRIASRASLRYADLLARSGDLKGAEAHLTRVTDAVPAMIPAWISRARISFQNADYVNTLKLLENVFSRDSSSFAGRVLEAQTYIRQGENQKAIDLLENTAKLPLYGNSPAIDYNLGVAFFASGERTRATDALDRAVAAKPGYVDALLLLSKIALDAGQYGRVVDTMRSILSERPGMMSAEYSLADAFRRLRQYDAAASVFQNRIDEGRNNSEDYVFLGIVRREQGDLEAAKIAFKKAEELSPEVTAPIFQLVGIDIEQKNYAAAEKRILEMISSGTPSAEAYYLLGRTYNASGDSEKEESALHKAIELRPDFTRAYERLVDIYARSESLEKALVQLDALLENNAGHAPSLIRKALIHERLQDYEAAKATYDSLRQFDPESVVAWNNLAYLLGAEGKDLDTALEYSEKARSIAREDATVADTLGWIHYLRGEYEAAGFLLREAAGKLSDMPEVDFHLGMLQYTTGNFDAARSNLQKAVAGGGNSRWKEEAIARLAILDQKSSGSESGTLDVAALEKLYQSKPGDPLVGFQLAQAYKDGGNTAEAIRVYESMLEQNPRFEPALVALAEFAFESGDMAQARSFAQRTRDISPDNAQSAVILGKIELKNGNYSMAHRLLGDALRGGSGSNRVLDEFLEAAYVLGRLDDARDAAEKVVRDKDSPEFANAEAFLELTAQNTSQEAGAVARAKQLLSGANEAPKALTLPAEILMAQVDLGNGRFEAADLRLRELLKSSPGLPVANRELAASLVYRYASDPDSAPALIEEAKEAIVEARAQLSRDVRAGMIYGTVLQFDGETNEAISILASSLDRDRSGDGFASFAHYVLGLAYAEADNATESAASLKRALDAGLPDPFASRARSEGGL